MAKQTKKEFIENTIKAHGYTLGCYNQKIEKLSFKAVNEILDNVTRGFFGDMCVEVRRVKYIVETCNVDNEVDLNILTPEEFESQYGWDFFEDEDE